MDAALLLPLLAPLILASPPARAAEVTRAQYVMGTILEITAHGPVPDRLQNALTAAFAEVTRLDDLLSTWNPDSEVSRLNRAAGGPPRTCPPPLAELLRLSLHYAALTGEAFVPTLHPLILAHGIEPGPRRAPGAEALRRAVALSATTQLDLFPDGRVHLRSAGAGVNFGAIGKGYALDRAGAVLAARGVRAARLNFGGQLLALGAPPGATAWEVVVADPRDPARALTALWIRDASVSSSRSPPPGHILDPHTGALLAAEAQATVVAPSATAADALSTACLVLGRERAAALASTLSAVSLYWF